MHWFQSKSAKYVSVLTLSYLPVRAFFQIQRIQEMPRPKDKTETKNGFLGMITYLTKFVPQLADVSQPLRNLTKVNY